MKLTDPISILPFIGKSYQELLANLEIYTIGDLLLHVPVRYNDTSTLKGIRDLSRDEKHTIKVRVDSLISIRLRNRKTLQKALVSDDYDQLEVMWFNQPFLTKSMKEGDEVLLNGKLDSKQLVPRLVSPQYERVSEQTLHLGRIVPHYPLTKGISLKWLRRRIKELIDKLDHIEEIPDLPDFIIEKYSLIDKKNAYQLIHFPSSKQEIMDSRNRLAFDELLDIQTKLMLERKKREQHKALIPSYSEDAINQLTESLPFQLTDSQINAYQEIHEEYGRGLPMRRILQGDVGSGKTIVAALAALPILESNQQVVLLAPTSVLASQHYSSLVELLPKYKIGLITSSTSKQDKSNADYDLIIGTHAVLYHQDKLIHNLGLLIIDEQHRFGVKQRKQLLEMTKRPVHLLQLTATPIPRSIALSLFGEYEVSYIKKPQIRKPVETFLTPEQKRADAYHWIDEKLKENGQAFWVVPLIDENEEIDAKAIETYQEELKQVFPNQSIKILHGQLPTQTKEQLLLDFLNKKFNILLSTTVIEVGINIPDANLIIIEDAHRFGLAQLHQLRGRVGRKNQQAWCLLFFDERNPEAGERLRFFTKEDNGLKIAEYDLQRRGPGEVYGTKQSGLPLLKVAKFSNLELLKQTREAAELLFKHNQL